MFKIEVRGHRNRTCKKPKTALSWVLYHLRELGRVEYVDPFGRQYWWEFPEILYSADPKAVDDHWRHAGEFQRFTRFMRRHFGITTEEAA